MTSSYFGFVKEQVTVCSMTGGFIKFPQTLLFLNKKTPACEPDVEIYNLGG